MNAIFKRRVDVDEYIIWSTIASVFMLVNVGRLGANIFLGYPVLLFNCAVLAVFNRLVIHRTHAIAIAALTAFAVLAAEFSVTPLTAIVAQIFGISLMSVYYLSALSTAGLTVRRWMDLYARLAFGVAIWGLVLLAVNRGLHRGDGRLMAFFAEPSLYVYTTLPALGYFVNCWAHERRYGSETLIFLLSYLISGSSLGFAGLLLVFAFTYLPRLKLWQKILGVAVGAGFVAILYLLSANLQMRANDTAAAIATADLADKNASTYAFLSNAYVAWRTFLDYPVLGVGLGGYQYAYPTYIVEISGIKPELSAINLNMEDANSLFFRVAAELGIPGLVLLIVFIIVCARVRGQPYIIIRNALLPYLLVRMGRYGAYFSLELYFFVGLYVFNYMESRARTRAPALAPPPRPWQAETGSFGRLSTS